MYGSNPCGIPLRDTDSAAKLVESQAIKILIWDSNGAIVYIMNHPKNHSRITVECKQCGRWFHVPKSRFERGQVKFCSQKCYSDFQTQPLERIWDHIKKEGDCWVWTAHKHPFGYGMIMVNGIPTGCHRISWELTNGPIPHGMSVLHKCDNPSCINPSHLFLGTQDDNMKDRSKKGRAPKGESHPMSKISEEMAIKIKHSMLSGYKCAALFHVSPSTVHSIRSGKTWRHISQ